VKYRWPILSSGLWVMVFGLMPVLDQWNWNSLKGDPDAEAIKPIHDLLGQIYGLGYVFLPFSALVFVFGFLLLCGNLMVDDRLVKASEEMELEEPLRPRDLSRTEWLEVIFHQDEVDFEALARKQAIDELREDGVLQTPAEHSNIEDPTARRTDRSSRRRHGRPTPSSRKRRH